jgi:hypothetical protein
MIKRIKVAWLKRKAQAAFARVEKNRGNGRSSDLLQKYWEALGKYQKSKADALK